MKSPAYPVKAPRSSAPWLIAGLSCAAIFFLTLGAGIRAAQAPQKPPERASAEAPSGIAPIPRSIGKLLVSALALVPAKSPESVPLVAAVIENHEDARAHQEGLTDAIAVFELIVEGDISRFLSFFRSDKLPERIGPVRSLRTHMVDIALGYRPLLLHAGGHKLAYESLDRHPEIPRHDGILYDGRTYVRDGNIAPPHNLFMPREALQKVLEDNDVRGTVFPIFGNQTSNVKRKKPEPARRIEVSFGNPVHDVTYSYNPLSGAYNRATGGAPGQAQPENVVVLEARVEGFRDRGAIPWTQTFGGGRMLLFSKGTVREGRWERAKEEPFSFLDTEGNASELAKGQTWVMMLPDLKRVEWE